MATKSRGRAQQAGRVRAGARKQTPSPPLPVYLLSLTLENVRCFGPPQTLRLSDEQGRPARWTVILGNNGMGKTTLLQALTTFEPESPRSSRENAYVPKAFGQPWFPTHQHMGVARLAVEAMEGGLLAGDGRKEPVRVEYKFEPERGYFEWDGTDEAFLLLVCYGYGATRRMGAGALSTPKEAQHNDSLFLEDIPLRNAEEWLLQADYAASKAFPQHGGAAQKRDQIRRLLIDLLPEVSDLRFIPPNERNLHARVEVQTPYGWVPMRGLSLGYRTLIAWLVDLASRLFERYPESPNPLAEPAVVLVDEIDLHLHPTWQRQLIGYLTERFLEPSSS
ncbi:AAA family ATPase [Cystobacter fuscus]